ncbi:hypothetical protein EES45_22920 [Streptomyces sp. ADI97-07]|uniref:hypothetical protein n=1 Tax=Streptomyces sp. ADI97-07 TaxID=1522762 RepID=UPI000F54EEB3|nr:hypothetical protein [Streptomyces sp. ADI97-07]RPK76615.1 hypothetical protein EES45_22920 [Streptomyces sp. ADI97-07]
MSDMPRIAREIRVERHGRTARLFIDGDEFPFHIAADDPIVVGPISGDDMPTVRFTVLAERVDLINDYSPEPDDQEKNP